MISWTERAKVAIGQDGQYRTAKTDETAVHRLLAVSTVCLGANPGLPVRISSVLAVPSPNVWQKCGSSNFLIEDPDRWCWPHSSAMTGAEIGLFLARQHTFTGKGLPRSVGETLADKLVIRDRELDDRQVCLECIHSTGHGAPSWRCGNWRNARVAHQSGDAKLAADLVVLLQRCSGFAASRQIGGDPKD